MRRMRRGRKRRRERKRMKRRRKASFLLDWKERDGGNPVCRRRESHTETEEKEEKGRNGGKDVTAFRRTMRIEAISLFFLFSPKFLLAHKDIGR